MSGTRHLYCPHHLYDRHTVFLPRMADEWQSKLERLMNVNALRFDELSPGGAPSASKRVGGGAQAESRIQTLSLVLESLWLFYDAMRSGKPLACGDERLAQMRAALSSPQKEVVFRAKRVSCR